MILLDGVERVYGASDDTGALLFISVSTGAELPALGNTVHGRLVTAGSYADVIQAGAMYRLDADGKWYACDGTGEYTDSRSTPETKKAAEEPEEKTEEPELTKEPEDTPEDTPEVRRYEDIDF